MNVGDEMYRYTNAQSGERQYVYLLTLYVTKVTKCGVWITYSNKFLLPSSVIPHNSKFVNMKSRKKYAYPTKQEALEQFIIRKDRQIKICNANAKGAGLAKFLAESMLKEMTT